MARSRKEAAPRYQGRITAAEPASGTVSTRAKRASFWDASASAEVPERYESDAASTPITQSATSGAGKRSAGSDRLCDAAADVLLGTFQLARVPERVFRPASGSAAPLSDKKEQRRSATPYGALNRQLDSCPSG
jgi:hypothetical protein